VMGWVHLALHRDGVEPSSPFDECTTLNVVAYITVTWLKLCVFCFFFQKQTCSRTALYISFHLPGRSCRCSKIISFLPQVVDHDRFPIERLEFGRESCISLDWGACKRATSTYVLSVTHSNNCWPVQCSPSDNRHGPRRRPDRNF
jgi:hypothetical protein